MRISVERDFFSLTNKRYHLYEAFAVIETLTFVAKRDFELEFPILKMASF